MNQLDVYYRALTGYRALTRDNRECTVLRKAMAQTDTQNDRLEVTRNVCTVDEDWIIAIEKGLVFVEKAIKEERQFIYSQGEVEPIEKVKHISKESVIHLAKHSNLITKEQQGEDIIPDQLYNVERLNDYAVYENRFLYMLLCYLRDFVTIRYNKILDLTNRYDGVLVMNKEINLPNRTVKYSVDLHEVRKDDPYLRDHNPAREVIDRIDLILKTVLSFLSTPLMEIAGKAAKLKPPITKTNVLKMDNNFKGAVALYEFIVAYDKPGFTSKEYKTEFAPFGDTLADEMAEAGSMMSFLVYEYGLGINSELKQSYLEEEARRKTEEIRRRSEQLAALKKRLNAKEISPEEYMLSLEKQIKLLEADNRQLEPLRIRVKELEESERRLNLEIQRLNCKIDALVDDLEAQRLRYELMIEELKAEHAGEIESIRAAHAEEIEKLVSKHQTELEIVRLKHAEELRQIDAKHAEDIAALNADWQARLDALELQMQAAEEDCRARIEAVYREMREHQNECDRQIAELNGVIDAANGKIDDGIKAYEQLTKEYNDLLDEKLMCDARIRALKIKLGVITPDATYTEKEHFDGLETEFNAFNKFYKKCWNMAKKEIRKDMLNYKTLIGFDLLNKK